MKRRVNERRALWWSAIAFLVAGCSGGGGASPMDDPAPPGAPQNAAPTLSTVPDQSVDEDGVAGPIEVMVSDAETDAADLDLTVTSTDPALLPESGIELAGEGGERTLYLVPAPGRSGDADVLMTVTDADRATNTRSFRLSVMPLFRAEFTEWMRGTVLARGDLEDPVGAPNEDGSPLPDVEDIVRIRFSDATVEDPAAYDDLLPSG